MEKWKELEVAFVAACTRLGLPVVIKYAPFQDNVPQREMDGGRAAGLTTHETGNPHIGADARAQQSWVQVHHGGGAPNLASYTMSTDDKRCVLICRLNYVNYHSGKTTGNRTHGSNELCVNVDGNWPKAKDNAAKADAAFLFVHEMLSNDTTLKQHNFWTGKNCPQQLRERGEWNAHKAAVGKYLSVLRTGMPVPAPDPVPVPPTHEWFPQTGHSVGNAILSYYNREGRVAEFGYPLTDEYRTVLDGLEYTAQIFERTSLVFDPRTGQVTRGLIGAWYLSAMAELEQFQKTSIGG